MNPLDIIGLYYPLGSESRRILIDHSHDVTTLALEVAQRHPELEPDLAFIEEAAMLHDIGIFLTRAPKIDCYGASPYMLHGYLGAELLRHKHGLYRHAMVAERHTGSGLMPEDIRQMGLDLPEGIYYPCSVEEQIICYADKFFSKSKLGQCHSLDKVRRSMLKYGEAALERFDRLHERFA
ncbi:HD domain-containing protein [Porphyromonas sp. COT-239 OH1446]|uniref:HD domain-containing protein n=1 Tax=Porphyromonas sp. COT-239 OH1446 TaxID=1515613 RepID=UPI00052C8B45|nr:HD domain-containing protein [Porphyromonas sp. COT-239 OH1446]KGN71348.1 phosphohydrolase [Porphyromonas sp. COT-239 OH1446]